MTPKSRADAARAFPTHTCAASRHAQQIGEGMASTYGFYETDSAEEEGESILSTVASLWEARARIAEQDELLNAIRDLFPRSSMSKPVHKLVAERIAQLEGKVRELQESHMQEIDAWVAKHRAAIDAARGEK